MDAELMLDVGQANELKLAFRRAHWTNENIKEFCEGDVATDVLLVIRGQAKIVLTKDIIDCNASPFLPENWKVENHKKQGRLEWNPEKVLLYLSDSQKDGRSINGGNLRKDLENKPVLNANVLDYLLAHRELIPEEWKNKYVFFWGTIYRRPFGDLCVRCLRFMGDGGRWDWYYNWLDNSWDDYGPAACSQIS